VTVIQAQSSLQMIIVDRRWVLKYATAALPGAVAASPDADPSRTDASVASVTISTSVGATRSISSRIGGRLVNSDSISTTSRAKPESASGTRTRRRAPRVTASIRSRL
jgi:hypothetical protein